MELITCSNVQKDSIATFDTLCTNPQIQLLKILIPFIAPSMQGTIAFYIKLMELNYTMYLFRNHNEIRFDNTNANLNEIYDELDPYLNPDARSKLKSLKDMFQNFANMKEMMEMVDSMKDMFPDGFDMSDMGGMENIFDMMNQFGGMDGTDTEQTGMDE